MIYQAVASRVPALLLIAAVACLAIPPAEAQESALQELWVGHELVDCPSDPARLCYVVKEEQYEEWRAFEGSLADFHYREGVAYILLVRREPAAEPSGERYRVVQILEEFESFDEPEIPDRTASSTGEAVVAPEVEPPSPAPVEPAPVAEPVEVAPAQTASPPRAAAPVAEPVEVAPAQATSPPRAAAPPAEHHRGILIIGSGLEARSFTPCGDDIGLWIEDASGASLWQVYRERVDAPNQPLLIEVTGEFAAAPSSGFGSHYPRQLTVAEVLRVDAVNTECIERAAEVAAVEPREPLPESTVEVLPATVERRDLLITGGSPSWNLSVGPESIVLVNPSAETLRFPYEPPDLTSGRITYDTTIAGTTPHSLKIVIAREPCPDPATGVRREFTAYLTLDRRWLRGCVVSGDPPAVQ